MVSMQLRVIDLRRVLLVVEVVHVVCITEHDGAAGRLLQVLGAADDTAIRVNKQPVVGLPLTEVAVVDLLSKIVDRVLHVGVVLPSHVADVLRLSTVEVHAESVGAVEVLTLALVQVFDLLQLGLSDGSCLSESHELGFLLVVGLLEEDLGDLLGVGSEHFVDV